MGVVIGSAAGAGLRIDSSRAAGRHAVIARGSDGAVCIEDVSGVGLLVNGEVLTGGTRRLRGGDRISIAGRHMFVTDGTVGLMPTVGRRGAAPDPRPPQAPGAPPARWPHRGRRVPRRVGPDPLRLGG
jgi:ribosome-associated protein YbcJ (S4-like RNA binding protein)